MDLINVETFLLDCRGDHIAEYSAIYDNNKTNEVRRFVALIYKQMDGPLNVKGLTHFDSKTLRTQRDSRGELHVKTVATYQKLGKPVAGNFWYVDFGPKSHRSNGKQIIT